MRYFTVSAIIVIFSILGGLIFLSSQTTSEIKNKYQPSFDHISSQKDMITRALSQTSILMDRISDYNFENFEFYSRVLVSHVKAAKDINIKPFKSLLSGKNSIYILDELEAALLEYKQASEDVIHEYRKLNEHTNEKISEQKLNPFINGLRKLVKSSTRYDVALMHIEGSFSKKIKYELGKTLNFILYALITLSAILFLTLLFINKNYKERKQSLEKIQKSESKLRESEERFGLAMNAYQDGLYDWNLTNNEIYYSPAWKSILGYKEDELPNDFSIWESLTDPKDVKQAWKMQNELINRKRDRFVMEFKMKHKEGHWVDILSRATAIFNNDGIAIRIVGTHTDITNSKAYEKLILEKEKAIRLALDAAKAGTWTWDIENGDVVWDDRMQEIFGLEPGTFDGTFEAWKKRVHPDDFDAVEKATLDSLKSLDSYEYEYRVKGNDEGWRIVTAHAAVLTDDTNKPIRMSGFAMDVTERRTA